MTPELSIITINYNDANGLKKTIESVINQTFNNYEYIIIDGGSNDGSVDVIRQYENNIDYWVSEPDKGIYNAMNKGVAKACGCYIQFLNSGDYLNLESTLENLFKLKKGTPDLLYGNMIKVYPNGQKKIDRGQNTPITLETLIRHTINHSSSIVKKSVLEKTGSFDESLKIVSDWKFYLQAFGLNNAEIQYIDLDITVFNMLGISSTQMDLRNQERIKVLQNAIPKPILTDLEQYILLKDKLNVIQKYSLTSKLFRLSEVLLIRLSKIIDFLTKKQKTNHSN